MFLSQCGHVQRDYDIYLLYFRMNRKGDKSLVIGVNNLKPMIAIIHRK